MRARTAFAPGKIILTGEYAVVFGHPGVAVPARRGIRAVFEEDLQKVGLALEWPEGQKHEGWVPYLEEIAGRCAEYAGQPFCGTLTIEGDLPLGKGMGSSTSMVIAVARSLLGEKCEEQAIAIEDAVNPGHSGLDFSVIWSGCPLLFRRGTTPEFIDLPEDLLAGTLLVDTGTPNEATPELVSWVEARKEELAGAFAAIGRCSERLAAGGDLREIMREHHKAQMALGVVPRAVADLVAGIESAGGSAKVIGAGGRTGGGGMLLATHEDGEMLKRAIPEEYPTYPL